MKYEEKQTNYGIVITCIPETEEEIQEMNEQKSFMDKVSCKCESPTDSYYVPDNESDECQKHHWRCEVCNKITQIG
jgi:hypothetical protein